MKKRRKWPWIVLAVVAAAVILLTVIISSAANDLKNTVYTAYNVKKGDVTTSITASGTLRSSDSIEIDIPDGIEVEEVLASVGDKVKKGDKLAKVNINDARKAASQLSESVAALDAEISMSSKEKTSSVKSGVKGRVKAIYAKEGDQASAVISNYGCLALISASGEMYADITTKAELKAGDKLLIKWENGDDEAKVYSSIDGGYRIVFDDDKAPYLKEVEVYHNKELIGKAETQIVTPISVYCVGGKIDEIKVQTNDSVSAGSTMFTVEDGLYSSAYLELLSKREQSAKALKEAAALVDDPYITATTDGVISEINALKGDSLEAKQQSTALSGTSTSGMTQMPSSSMGSNASALSAASSAAFVIESGSVNKMIVTVNELDIKDVKTGQMAQVIIDAFEDQEFEAEVTKVSNYGKFDGSMSNYLVEMTIKNDGKLLSGMNGSAVIVSNSAKDVLLIPVEAINEDAEGAFVYVSQTGNTDGSDKKEVRIKTGLSDGVVAEVTEGLKEGDKVMYVRSGMTMFEQMMSMRDEMMGKGSAQ